MNPKRKQRLIIVLFIVFGAAIAVGLVMYALNQNINLFYSPTDIVEGKAPEGTRIRAGGMVVEGSVNRDQQSLQVEFGMTDYANNVTVVYNGILPDLFREGQGIVAQGQMNSEGVFEAVEVLAKHDENYMPPEVADALERAGQMPEQIRAKEAGQQ
ncbi:cytochrome c maturation protein CcmE [Amphritea balenae]|uniref:Cytochrome c-type biogenesis protein CcmE n=1 Tax=Amphritea balenae TaxID=452629 RepID=A0A3P1SQ00_9GAMM|nr:cytochrome c maturation protein CcmE [Amphritea balenae]RRC99207.1 cytochrome c maturation protein CcmE [Amphritea balenae]GGK73079.1 cytochrome c-type biogenesis protein CcmE [Amphritea balenae]